MNRTTPTPPSDNDPDLLPADYAAAVEKFHKGLAAVAAQLRTIAAQLAGAVNLCNDDPRFRALARHVGSTLRGALGEMPGGLDPEFINRLIRFGNDELAPSLLFDYSPAAVKLATLPFPIQEETVRVGVVVLDKDEDGKEERIFAYPHELFIWHADQVIDDEEKRIRTIDEQREFLEE